MSANQVSSSQRVHRSRLEPCARCSLGVERTQLRDLLWRPLVVVVPSIVVHYALPSDRSSLRRFAPSLGIPPPTCFIVPHSGASHLRSESRRQPVSSFLTPALRTFARNPAANLFRRESRSNGAPRLEQLSLRCSGGDPQPRADLFVCEALDIMQYEHGAITGRQSNDRRLEVEPVARPFLVAPLP